MYIVPDLEYEQKYIDWATKKYPNCEFIKTPHYCLGSFIQNGYLGIKQDKAHPKNLISKIDCKIKKITGIEWSCYGFKKQDGITRRLMLGSYKNGLFLKTKKAYPLMDLTNKDVLNYIKDNNLITPFNYGTAKPSSGCDISTIEFLLYIREKYPNDLKKIFQQFPFTEINLFKHDNYENKTERNNHHLTE